MAVDEALLRSFDPNASLPVLRLYGWQPPALSLGRFQNAGEILSLAACRRSGVPVVRRITGGGVIYHADELTYSIVCSPHHLPAPGSIKESFRVLTSFLLLFYVRLGLDARYAADVCAGQRLGERTPFCFAGKESYDILVAGRKIGGNAQRRLRNVIFQHGSIPLRNRVNEGMALLREKPEGIEVQTACLDEMGITVTGPALKEILVESFREAMGAELQVAGYSADEQANAAALLLKYRDDSWNLRGEMGQDARQADRLLSMRRGDQVD
jgi:lipoyl(octanoyl) transferase